MGLWQNPAELLFERLPLPADNSRRERNAA